MKKTALLLCIVGILVYSILPIHAYTQDNPTTVESKFEYSITGNKTIRLTKYTGQSRNIVIPDEICGLKVTKLNKNLIPETIYAQSFTISMNKYITNVSDARFYNYKNLSKITVDKENKTLCIKNGILYNKEMTKLLFCPASKDITVLKVPNTVKIIEKYAFLNQKHIRNVELPSGLQKIKREAFANCKSLRKAFIPQTVRLIDECAYYDCDMLSNLKIVGNKHLRIGSLAFAGCDNIKKLKLPLFEKNGNSSSYFYSCSSLSSVTIPNKLTYLPAECFYDCRKLKSITVPSSVKQIKQRAIGIVMGNKIDKVKKGFVIKGKKGSAAEKYAKANKLKFKAI